MENHGQEYVHTWLLSNLENRTAEQTNVNIKSKLLIIGASHANFSVIAKQISADNNGMPNTPNASQSEADEEISSVNFFPLGR